MGMSVGSSGGMDRDAEVVAEMNTTPLIDVMLVLLIMLIITIPIQTHATKLNMPVNSSSKPTTPPPVVQIDIDENGTIFFNGDTLADRTAVEARLTQIADMPEQPEVHLRPHKLAKYDKVAMVMAAAQRIGVTKIGLVGSEQFME
ncbi:ExbD/TolR family protein [Niveibacterium terrae]|uniref:ExbD/TolR family protein n=1 Tax=Niveibacterium terrae TaxID=3373598 RepID=UPI003A8EEBE8